MTFSIWQFLTSPHASEVVEAEFPDQMRAGTTIDEIVDGQSWPDGFVSLLRAHAAVAAPERRNKVTPFAAKAWSRAKQKLLSVIPKVTHWQITNLQYHELPDVRACWFVDAPYCNAAGDRYRQPASNIDFTQLGEWCRARQGQLICCENVGATWLPFAPLTSGRRGIKSRTHKSTVGEAVYERSDRSSRPTIVGADLAQWEVAA